MNKVIQFPIYRETDTESLPTKQETLKKIADGTYRHAAFLWAQKDAMMIQGTIEEMNLMSLNRMVLEYWDFMSFFYNSVEQEVLAMRWDVLKNTRSYRWIGNYKNLQADSRDNYNRLIRNGDYLYIVNCRRDLAKIMGWEMTNKF